MSRLLSFLTLLLLISLVIFMYFLFFTETEQETLFISNEDILIPTGEPERETIENSQNLKSTYLALLGILILIYLKIIWKLITLEWCVFGEKEEKRKMMG